MSLKIAVRAAQICSITAHSRRVAVAGQLGVWLHYVAALPGAGLDEHGVRPTVPARPPKRSRLIQRWPALRRWFGKGLPASAGQDASAQSIRDYFRHKAQRSGLHPQPQPAARDRLHGAAGQSVVRDASAHTPPSLYLYRRRRARQELVARRFLSGAADQPQKRRLHFHQFFAQLHQGMFSHREHDDALDSDPRRIAGGLSGAVFRRVSCA